MSPRPPRAQWPGSLLANLAATPFVNKRPVQRFTLAAWVVGALLAAANVFLWLQYRHDSTALRARLADTRSAIEARSRNVVEMDRELRSLGLNAQNAQVDFLNQRIAERTFPWSVLFERIATTLPDGVRLLGLNPVFRGRDRGPTRGAPAAAPEDEVVAFKFTGVAKSDQDIYQLVDAFFSSPVFDHPRLNQESRNAAEVQFTVDVEYRPRLEPAAAPALVDEAEPSHQPAAARASEAMAEAGGEVDG